jgi:hypothetical protein
MVVFGDRFLLFGCIPIVPMLEYMRPMRLWMGTLFCGGFHVGYGRSGHR